MSERVKAWMTKPLLSVAVDDPVYRAVEIMADRAVRHVVVLDPWGDVTGILSNRDIIRLAMRDPEKRLDLHGSTVGEIMTPQPLHTVRSDASLRAAAKIMHRRKISALPVLDGDRLQGVITSHDVMRAVSHDAPCLQGA